MRDNHPRFRQARKLERRKAFKPDHDRILVVCEGEKTEPNYFNEIRRKFRLSAAHVSVIPSSHGTSPSQIVDAALEAFLESKEFERVYCVFDRDDHLSFYEAIARCKELNNSRKNDLNKLVQFTPIPSNPCFELWILIHFGFTTRELHRREVYSELRTVFPDYAKNAEGVYSALEAQLTIAFENAERLRAAQAAHGRDNPMTDVDVLVKDLLALKTETA